MSLHAGFAAAASLSGKAIQQFLRAAYVNDVIKTRYQGAVPRTSGTSPKFPFTLGFDLFLVEPQVKLAPSEDNKVQLRLEFLGTLTFTAVGKPTLACEVHVRMDARMPVILQNDAQNQTVSFGLNSLLLDASFYDARRTSGSDPKTTYGFDVEGNDLKNVLTGAIALGGANQFLISPPTLGPLAQAGYTLDLNGVRVTAGMLHVGVDVRDMTSGSEAALVDLNTISTAKGLRKTFKESIHTADDEYGEPIYDTGWTPTSQRPAGPHNSDLSVSLNSVVLADIFNKVGRPAILSAFAEQKQKAIDKAKADAKKNDVPFVEPQIAKIDLDQINVQLAGGHLLVTGEATAHVDITVTTSFSLKLSLVRTDVDGSTAFVMANQDKEGLTGEVYDPDVSVPWWVTFLEVLVGIAGVVLAPFTAGVSFIVAVMLDLVASAVVSTVTGNAESQLGGSVLKAISGNQGNLPFTLPNTTGPTITLGPNDVVLAPDALTSWFGITSSAPDADIHLKAHPGSTIWEVTNRKDIVVVFDPGEALYNASDPKLRIRWEVYGDSTAYKLKEVDQALNSAGPDPKEIAIPHAQPALDVYDTFIVKCRVYRPWGDWTQEIFARQLTIIISDRLRRQKPYVTWNHTAFYQGYSAKLNDPSRQGTGWVVAERVSKIHRTNPDKRCRFADNYTPDLGRDDLTYLDALPFPIANIAQHRKEVCPYCFFGGPDKTVLKP